jgi:hypothetical protein
MQKKLTYLLFSFLLFSVCAVAQTAKKKKVIQLTGIVISADTLQAVSYTSVLVSGTNRGTMADASGYFSLVITAGDTLKFSCVGFTPETYYLPDTLTQNSYSLIQMMKRDTLIMPTITISKWPSYQQFKYAFENKAIPEGDLEFAKRNLNRIEANNSEYKADASLNQKWQQSTAKNQLYYNGQIPPNNLLNPIAWASFLKAWKNGELKIEK